MKYQKKFRITFGSKYESPKQTVDVYAFDVEGALFTAMQGIKDETAVPAISKVEEIKEDEV